MTAEQWWLIGGFVLLNVLAGLWRALKEPQPLPSPNAIPEDAVPASEPSERPEEYWAELDEGFYVFFNSFTELVVLERADGSRLSFGAGFPFSPGVLVRRLLLGSKAKRKALRPASVWIPRPLRWVHPSGVESSLDKDELTSCLEAIRRGGRKLGYEVTFEGPGVERSDS